MHINFTNKTAVITGAGGAIGSAMALRFAQSGAQVAVCDINAVAGEATAKRIRDEGLQAECFALDVTRRESAEAVMAAVSDHFGGIDILVNNAGVNVGPGQRLPIHQFADDQWDRIVKVDLDGVYHVSRAAIPYIIARGGGSIINISSVVGLVPFRNQCAFAAAKAGVVNLTRAMALELAPEHIRVNAIAPGSIAMEGTAALFNNDSIMEALLNHIPQHRQGTPDDIAYPTVFLASEMGGYMTGSVMTVDGGWTCGYARDF